MPKLIPEPWKYIPPPGIRLIDVRSTDELAQHANAWSKLLLSSHNASPMGSYPQISAFFETQLTGSNNWLCLFAYEADRLIGVLPLIAARSIGIPGFSLLLMKTPYDDLHTSGVGCIMSAEHEEIFDVLLSYINKMPGKWPVIRMRELLEHDLTIHCFNRESRRISGILTPCGKENYIEVPKSYESFHAEMSSNFKRQLKRGNRKLEELKDVRFRFGDFSRSPSENIRRFEEIEDKGWKGASNSSIKAVEQNSKFFSIAAERFQNEGWLVWNFIEIGETSIAAHFALKIHRTLFLLKICYDEEFATCSPGNLLLDNVIQNACAMGDLDEINCVADGAWHRNWKMKERTIYELLILPKIPIVSAIACCILKSKTFEKVKGLLGRGRDKSDQIADPQTSS